MHFLLTIYGVILLPISSVLAGTRAPQPASMLDIRHNGANEERSIQDIDARLPFLSTDDEHLPRLMIRNDDDDNERDQERDDDDNEDDNDDDDDDDNVIDEIKDKANDIGDDIEEGADDVKEDVKDGVDDVFEDGVGTLRPGNILPVLFAAIIVAIAGM